MLTEDSELGRVYYFRPTVLTEDCELGRVYYFRPTVLTEKDCELGGYTTSDLLC